MAYFQMAIKQLPQYLTMMQQNTFSHWQQVLVILLYSASYAFAKLQIAKNSILPFNKHPMTYRISHTVSTIFFSAQFTSLFCSFSSIDTTALPLVPPAYHFLLLDQLQKQGIFAIRV